MEMAWLGSVAKHTGVSIDYLLREVALGHVWLDSKTCPPTPPEPTISVVLKTSQATQHVKARARPVELDTTLTTAEFAELSARAAQAGMPFSRYVLAAVFGRVKVPGSDAAERLPTVEEAGVQAELHRVIEAGVWMWCAGLEVEQLEHEARLALQRVHERGLTRLDLRLIEGLQEGVERLLLTLDLGIPNDDLVEEIVEHLGRIAAPTAQAAATVKQGGLV